MAVAARQWRYRSHSTEHTLYTPPPRELMKSPHDVATGEYCVIVQQQQPLLALADDGGRDQTFFFVSRNRRDVDTMR